MKAGQFWAWEEVRRVRVVKKRTSRGFMNYEYAVQMRIRSIHLGYPGYPRMDGVGGMSLRNRRTP
jgi:hypothetical protein